MRYKIILPFLIGFMLCASSVFGQKVNLEINDATLEEVFREIKKQTGQYFMYDKSIINENLKIDVQVKDKSLKEVLDDICSKTPYTYELVDDFILIKVSKTDKVVEPKKPQKIKINGVVKDVKGIPIPGVTVHLKGTTIGTVTDFDGNFEFLVPEGSKDILVISCIGFNKQEKALEGLSVFDFVLEEEEMALSEVVVTGYQQIKTERATGSFAILNEDDMKTQVTNNIVNKLEGTMPGVLINEDNTFEIRGVSTLYGNTQPIFVIDGVPVETDLSKINPEDIAQITVLKDAASAAIYGVRASNGVVVITTKSAKKDDKLKIDFSSFFTVGSKYDLNDYQSASSAQMVDLEQEYIQRFVDFNTTNANIDNNYYGYTKVYDIYRQQREGTISQSEAIAAYNQLRANNHTQQFSDLFLQNQFDQNYSLSLRGAGERSKYYLSVGYVDSKSGFVGADNDRLTLNLKNDFEMASWLDVGVNIYAAFLNSSNNSVGSEYMNRKPYEMIVAPDGSLIPQYKDWSMKAKGELEQQGYLNWDYNVLNDLNTRDNTTESMNLRISAYAKFKIIEGLNFTTTYYTEFDRSDLKNFNAQNSYYTTNLINRATVLDTNGDAIRHIPLGGISNNMDTRSSNYTFRNQFDFSKYFGESYITILAGNEVREQNVNSFEDIKYGVDQNTLQYSYIDNPGSYFGLIGFNYLPLNLGAVDYFYDKYTAYLGRDVSYYGNFSWLYKEKYSVTGSVRLDQSNLFGVDKRLRNNPLWSVGLLWNLDREDFITSEAINRLTLKVSYGITGNVKRDLLTEATASSGTNRFGEVYLQPRSAQNNGVGHESTASLNIATQFMFFNKLSGNLAYFSKNSSNLLGERPIEYTLGWSKAWSNYASTSNSGVEVALNYPLLRRKDWQWDIGVNYTYVSSKVKEVDNTTDVSTYYAGRFRSNPLEGYPIDALFAYRSGGVNSDGDGIILSESGEEHLASDVASLKSNDLAYMGSTTPTYYGGINTNLRYRQFSLDLLFTYKGGHVSRMPHPIYIDGYGISSNTHESIANRWRNPGDENIPNILPALRPSAQYYNNEDYGMYHTDNRVFDADFIRFKKLSLSYDWVPKVKMPLSVQVYGEVRNLALLTKNNLDIDPDFINPYSGTLRLSQPTSFVFGLRMSF